MTKAIGDNNLSVDRRIVATQDVARRPRSFRALVPPIQRRAAGTGEAVVIERTAPGDHTHMVAGRHPTGRCWTVVRRDESGETGTHDRNALSAMTKLARSVQRAIPASEFACCRKGDRLFIFRTDDSLAVALQFAELLRTTAARNGSTWSVGLKHATHDQSVRDGFPRAAQALDLARSLGGDRVCTWEMVRFAQLAARLDDGSTADRLRQILRRSDDVLGPTQREHLTTHARRVSDTAVRIGEVLGAHRVHLEHLRLAGMCHDLGKLLIPEHVLAKPSVLSPAEKALINRHAADGAEMTARIGADPETVGFVKHHHQRFDDPQGAANVPLGAMILSVADAFVAMTSDRPYQAARADGEALAELECERGRQFSPIVVDAAVASLRKNG